MSIELTTASQNILSGIRDSLQVLSTTETIALTGQLVLNTDFNSYKTEVSSATATLLPTTTYQEASGNWQSTYNTFSLVSSTFLTSETDSQTLTFNEDTKHLSISNGNIVSLSALADFETAFSQSSAKYEDITTIVQGNSAQWATDLTTDTAVRSLTSKYEDTSTTVETNSATWNSAYNISTTYQEASSSFVTNSALESISSLLTPLTVTNTLTSELVLNTDFDSYKTEVSSATATFLPTTTYQNTSGSFATKSQINILDYGGVADATLFLDGVVTAGSFELSSNNSNFTSSINGKSIAVAGAGSWNNYTATITNATNTNPVVITFTLSPTADSTWNGYGAKIITSGNTNTAANGTFYLGTITSLGNSSFSAPLYTDQQIFTPRNGNGTSGGNGIGYFPAQLVTTVTLGSNNKTLIMANSAVASLTAARCVYGTDNRTALISSIDAIPRTPIQFNRSSVYIPRGNYFISSGINIVRSNFTLEGENMGTTTLSIGVDTIPAISIFRQGIQPTINIRNLTISFVDKPQQRYVGGSGIFAFGGNGTTQTLRNINIDNVEVVNAQVGIQLNSGVIESRVTNCYIRDTIADGIAVYSFSGPCRDILINNNRLYNTGDDSIANNSYSNNPDVNRSVIITNNIIDNSGAAGIASWGSDGCIIANNIIRNTYIMAIKAQAGDGFNSVSNLSIIGNQVYGAGQGYASGLPSYVPSRGPIAGISIVKVNTGVTVSNVTISNNIVAPFPTTGACYGQGIMLWDYALASNTFSNIKIDNNTLVGPFSALPGGYRTNPTGMTTTDGIMINSFNNASITNNYVFRPRENGIATGALTSGTLIVKDNIVDTPNTTATANRFGYLLQGNAIPVFKDNTCINFTTLAGIVNSTTTLYTLVTSSATGLSYTLRPTDNTVIICLSSPADNTFIVPSTITLPDFRVTIQQLGTGSITVSAAPGVIINSAGSKFRLNEQYATADLSYINSAIGWTLYGNLST